MTPEQTEAVARIREASAGKDPTERWVTRKIRKKTVRMRQIALVTTTAGDVVLACDAAVPDQVVNELRTGSASLKPGTEVHIEARHALHLLRQVDAAGQPMPVTPE